MMSETTDPKTLIEAVRYFSDPEICHAYMIGIKWPSGEIRCPKCGGGQIGHIRTRMVFQCKTKGCRKQFSTKVDTIFEDSSLGLDKWFIAVWMIANCKNGASSCELARAIGVTQKSAWHMLHRIRLAMKTKTFRKITGEIEADESFVGGKLKNMHKRKRPIGRGFVGKSIVMGLLMRSEEKGRSRVSTAIVPNTKTETLGNGVRDCVEPGATVYTDDLVSYRGLSSDFVHEFINHAATYARGRVHTNGLENFWSLLKRTLSGTYVSVNAGHLLAYLDEQVFRFNERKWTDASRFHEVMRNITERRLTYRELTGKMG